MKRLLSFRGFVWLALVIMLTTGLLLAVQSGRPGIQAGEPAPIATAGYLGITYLNVSMHTAASMNLPGTQGALITAVAPGSPAARNGLQPGDVIVSMDGQLIGDSCPLLQSLLARRAGDAITVAVQRGDQNLNLTVVLSQRTP